MAPTMGALYEELKAATSPYRIGTIDISLMHDVFRMYADSAACRTIGVDRSAWKKWKAFCQRHGIERLWRNNVAANSGADEAGHRREVYILRAFLVETHREMAPRRKKRRRAKPSSALNVATGVRRIHKRAMIKMVGCTHLAMTLRGLNAQYMKEEGSNKALLEEHKEPLNNAECRDMFRTPNGTVLRGWTVDWDSPTAGRFLAGADTRMKISTLFLRPCAQWQWGTRTTHARTRRSPRKFRKNPSCGGSRLGGCFFLRFLPYSRR